MSSAGRRGGPRGPGFERSGPESGEELDGPADPESIARMICLQLLNSRARTRAELAGELRRRSVPLESANVVLDRFVELGLVDDAALAGDFALARHAERGHAGRAIAAQLRRRGVEDDVIRAAIAQIDPASEAAAAKELASVRLARMGDIEATVAIRRLTGLLARRGYSHAVASNAVRAALAARDELDLLEQVYTID